MTCKGRCAASCAAAAPPSASSSPATSAVFTECLCQRVEFPARRLAIKPGLCERFASPNHQKIVAGMAKKGWDCRPHQGFMVGVGVVDAHSATSQRSLVL